MGGAAYPEVWTKYARRLVTVHNRLEKRIEWQTFSHDPPPDEPASVSWRQDAARARLLSYSPSFLDIILRRSGRRRAGLERGLTKAAARDMAEYQDERKAWSARVAVWERHGDLVRRVIAGDVEAWLQVLHQQSGLSRRDLFGAMVSYREAQGRLHVVVSLQPDDLLPAFERRLIAAGRYAPEKIPDESSDMLHRQHVASVALKVAGDVFQILPAEEVYLTCLTGLLNMSAGRQEAMPILSVQFNRDMFRNLNLRKPALHLIDNFRHVKDFRETGGFGPVKPLLPL